MQRKNEEEVKIEKTEGGTSVQEEKTPKADERKELENPSPEILINFPEQHVLDDLKSRYGKIFLTAYSKEDWYIWRTLTRQPHKQFLRTDGATEEWVQEQIFLHCVIKYHGGEINASLLGQLKAGTVPTTVTHILELSNFTQNATVLEL